MIKLCSCLNYQIDHDGRTVLYEGSTSLKLRVEKLVLPVDDALTQKIGIISGVLLAIIFLILLVRRFEKKYIKKSLTIFVLVELLH